ncbi:unnamed protein product, partial [Prorocentrum cordatum]
MLPRERGGSNARCSPHRLAKRAPPRLVIGRQLNATMVFGRAREKRRSWSRLAPRGMLWEYPSHRNATAAPGNGGAVIPASHAKCTSAFAPGTCVRRLRRRRMRRRRRRRRRRRGRRPSTESQTSRCCSQRGGVRSQPRPRTPGQAPERAALLAIHASSDARRRLSPRRRTWESRRLPRSVGRRPRPLHP